MKINKQKKMKNKHILIYRKQKNIEIILDYLDIPFA